MEPETEPKKERIPTIWTVDDELWAKIEPLIPPPKPAKGPGGRPPVADRIVLNGILYVLRSGCPWKHVPKEFGSGIPLSATVRSANKHDKTQVVNVLDALMLTGPECDQHICLDNGYDYPDVHQELASRSYQVHIPFRGLDTS